MTPEQLDALANGTADKATMREAAAMLSDDVWGASARVVERPQQNLSSESLIEWAAGWISETNRARFTKALANELRTRDARMNELLREAAHHLKRGFTSATLVEDIDAALAGGTPVERIAPESSAAIHYLLLTYWNLYHTALTEDRPFVEVATGNMPHFLTALRHVANTLIDAPKIPNHPEGWTLVPNEVTHAMQRAYFDVIDRNLHRVSTDALFGRHASAKEAYRAMLAAAPACAPKEKRFG